ncbi:MAG: ComEC/Rec2 family competence protein [Acutalibacteraceae bacterium]
MASRRKKSAVKPLTAVILLILAVISVAAGLGDKSLDTNPTTSITVNAPETDSVVVHFIDVGQGNSTLIQCGNNGVLIDGGEKEYGEKVCNYLKACGVEKLGCVIATHPHSDHIGGLINVLQSFSVDNVIMPRLTEENTPTTSIYEKFLTVIGEKKIKTLAANPGDTYSFSNCSLEILGPISQDDELNNMSVVCRLKAFSTYFMLLADAEKSELREIEASDALLEADVLQAGHHGSKTSVLESYLDSVNPEYAVISCGKDNKYGFPHDEIISYLKSYDIEYYRTDLLGSIVFTCTENGVTVSTD